MHKRFQKLIYLHIFTDCFMKISPQLSEQIQFCTVLLHISKFRYKVYSNGVVMCSWNF